MSDLTWKTKITQIKPNEVRLRGYRIDELMGQITFTQAVYLALKGDLPEPHVGKLLEALFVSSIDHGATPPSALAARTAASTGAPLNAALAVGVLSINRFHGAAIYDCMGVLHDGLSRASSEGKTIDQAALDVVSEYRTAKKRIAGLGHRVHTDDPRTAKLFKMAESLDLAGNGVLMMRALQSALASFGKTLPINVDGAIAALLVDLEMPRELANAFFIMARVPGLVAHVYEEETTQRPMRHIHPTQHVYEGPAPRSITKG